MTYHENSEERVVSLMDMEMHCPDPLTWSTCGLCFWGYFQQPAFSYRLFQVSPRPFRDSPPPRFQVLPRVSGEKNISKYQERDLA